MVGLAAARTYLPGLAVIGSIALAADVLAGVVPGTSPLVLAIAFGALLANAVRTPDWARPGIQQHKLLLETGIVLLGASLPLATLRTAGPVVLGLAFGVVVCTVALVEFLARYVFGGDGRTASLLASGASICGVSAVTAVGRSVDADSDTLAYVAGTILLFDAVTLVTFPVLGDVLDLAPKTFGLWAGLVMFSTGPVAAAGFSYSPVAGEWATLTKLVRNSFIGVLAVGYSVVYAGGLGRPSPRTVWLQFPKFLVGFVTLATLSSLGFLTATQLALVGRVSDALFLVAFAGLGFDLDVAAIRRAGLRPAGVVLTALLVMGTLVLFVVQRVPGQ